MSTVLRIENLDKIYRLGEVGTGTLSHDLNRWWHLVEARKIRIQKLAKSTIENPIRKVIMYMHKNINFDVEGESRGHRTKWCR